MMSNISTYIVFVFVLALMSIVYATEISSNGFDSTDKIGDNDVSFDKRPNFFVGSRYGRSPSSTPQLYESKTRRLNVVPRNDRFFLGSRYGKRSDENVEEVYEQDSSNQSNIFTKMTCVYTGFKNFYRCNNNNNNLGGFIEKLATAENYSTK